MGLDMKNILILGGGLSGISTAYFLQQHGYNGNITILEKENGTGGLCRTIQKGKYCYDIGPHILFSKDKEMLALMLEVLENNNTLKRSNQVLYKGRYIQYPFENDLSKLPKDELRYCIHTFNHNPYEGYDADNMIQFFLKTFGEGITNTYLRPYNEKIWKYDLAFMNTAMVERIPKPTKEEIRRSANGETVEGYLHQLYFHYPSQGGINSVVKGFEHRLDMNRCNILTDNEVVDLKKSGSCYIVKTASGIKVTGDAVISTIPIHKLMEAYGETPENIQNCVSKLHYNSIVITFVKTPYDMCGEHFTFTIPDKNIIFHRISKMDFLGNNYHHDAGATYVVEVTYRKDDYIAGMNDKNLQEKIRQGMCDLRLAKNMEDVQIIDTTKYEYAYVIYDLNHTANMKQIRQYYASEGIMLNGRFGNFEYWNMDRVLRESFELSKRLL